MNTLLSTLKQPHFSIVFSLFLLISLVALQACKPAASAETNAPMPPDDAPHIAAASTIDAGRYLIRVAGCNDCHTAGFMEAGFAIPEDDLSRQPAVARAGDG